MAKTVIAIDAMGGDFGPEITVPASLQVLKEYTDVNLILVGDTTRIQAILASHKASLSDNLAIEHASQQVEMDELPSQALRNKKDSSMRVAINLVKSGSAHACVSAGNTGALMATARFVLKTLPGVDRPAIITSFPTLKENKSVRVLDLGANVDSGAEHLYQFAVMGSSLVSAVENIEKPKVALLNIGQEEIKGNDQVKQSAQLLADSQVLNYCGYVEGDAIFKGEVDVVVCDGFVGNVALKAMEGIAKLISHYMKAEFNQGFFSRLAALVSYPVLNRLKKRLDPGRRNGASFVGLQGIVIKSHGGANKTAFTQAIREAISEVEHNVPEKISAQVAALLKDATHE